jgi:PIN domain nuclease of toxin-antitoxin system
MKVLLDTHAFLWWVAGDPQLSEPARDLIADGSNEVLFSVASAWEIVVKTSIGRLWLEGDPETFIDEQLEANAFGVLPIHLRHALAIAGLPDLHRDPFERMLVAQAMSEGISILSGDQQVAAYPVDVVW